MDGEIEPPLLGRRRFLAAAGLLPWTLLPPLGDRARSSPPALVSEARDHHGGGDLAPRVVGLRSLGGAFRFDPPGLRIESAAELTWLNMGDFHTVTAFHPDNSELLGGEVARRIPEDAESWHSGMLGLDAGSRYARRFEVEGVYDYFCQPHYGFGMLGRLVVGRAHGGPATRASEADLPEAARGRLPRVERIVGPTGRLFEWAARLNGVLHVAADGGDAARAARTTAREVAADPRLHDALSPEAWSATREALDGFVRTAERGDGYEALMAAADAAKEPLRRAWSEQ